MQYVGEHKVTVSVGKAEMSFVVKVVGDKCEPPYYTIVNYDVAYAIDYNIGSGIKKLRFDFRHPSQCNITYNLSRSDALANTVFIENKHLVLNVTDYSLAGTYPLKIVSYAPSGAESSTISVNITLVDPCATLTASVQN